MLNFFDVKYCRSGNIGEVLFFANLARRTNSRISRKNYYYNSATIEKLEFKHAKITRSTVSSSPVSPNLRRLALMVRSQ